MNIKRFIYNNALGLSPLPFFLTMNISNICNRTCVICPYHSQEISENWYSKWWKAQPKLMDFEKFALMLANMGVLRHWVKLIAVTGKGEPLSHPDFLKFCREINQYGIWFTVTTNGDRLTKLLEYELSKLEYLKYVRISVYDNPDHWLKIKENSLVPMWLYNETGTHVDGMVDGYVLYTNPGTEKYCTIPKDFVTVKTCSVPFSFNTLNTDGSLVPCYSFYEVGNVFTTPFWKVINGKQMRFFRKKALVMQAPTSNCKNCGYFMKSNENKTDSPVENIS